MAKLFDKDWMQAFGVCWNADEKMPVTLAEADFSAKIGYGFPDKENPTGLLIVRKGRVERGDVYRSELLDWDMRALPENWRDWLRNGLGFGRFGYVIGHKKLEFRAGNPRSMLAKPLLAHAFLRSFEVMAQVKTEWDD